jgi:hypothetical protein
LVRSRKRVTEITNRLPEAFYLTWPADHFLPAILRRSYYGGKGSGKQIIPLCLFARLAIVI